MTTQLINPPSPTLGATASRQPTGINKTGGNSDLRWQQLMQSYPVPSQVEYLHLQAEIEVLWQQLQTLKQQKLQGIAARSEAN